MNNITDDESSKLIIIYLLIGILLYFLFSIYKISKDYESIKHKLLTYKYILIIILLLFIPIMDYIYYRYYINNNNLSSIFLQIAHNILVLNVLILLIIYIYNDLSYCPEIIKLIPFFKLIKYGSIIILIIVTIKLLLFYIIIKKYYLKKERNVI